MTEPLGRQDLHPDEDLLVEVVLGQAASTSRDEVVRHLSLCPTCRRDYDDLAGAVELVLPAIPRLAPPPTFEARMLARLDAARHPATGVVTAPAEGSATAARPQAPGGGGPTRRTALRLAVAGLVGLATGAGVTAYLVRADEEVVDPLWSAPLVTDAGARVGRVWQSYGEAGEVLVVDVDDGPVGRRYTCRLRLVDGSTEDVGEWTIASDRPNSWVVEVPDVQAVAVELVAGSGGVWATAPVRSNPN